MSANYYIIIIIIIIGLCQYSISTHKKIFTFCFAFAKAEKIIEMNFYLNQKKSRFLSDVTNLILDRELGSCFRWLYTQGHWKADEQYICAPENH